jgi:hypothetical protein
MDTVNRAKRLQDRTKASTVRIIKAFVSLPKMKPPEQRETFLSACRAPTAADFISKISVVAEETDETLFWLELLVQAEMITAKLNRAANE